MELSEGRVLRSKKMNILLVLTIVMIHFQKIPANVHLIPIFRKYGKLSWNPTGLLAYQHSRAMVMGAPTRHHR